MRSRNDLLALFPDEVLERILQFITSDKDRNSVSLVCKTWNKVEADSRCSVFVGNCYSISPDRLIHRFHNVLSITLKGKPRFSDFDLLPRHWGAYALPWVEAFCRAYPHLEEIRLKRMTICDESLQMIARNLTHFKKLILTTCDGFSSGGLASIVKHCKLLECVDLSENKVEGLSGSWLNQFHGFSKSLVSLNLENIRDNLDYEILEELVGRCTMLDSLKLNRSISLTQMEGLLSKAPQLSELGTGSFAGELSADDISRIQRRFSTCQKLTQLSGFWEIGSGTLITVYPVCQSLISLDLSYCLIAPIDFIGLVSQCDNLQRLWILDSVGDSGLKAAALTCKGLKHLRVFPSEGDAVGVSEEGLMAISEGCSKLSSILYFCKQITNDAVISMSRGCPLLETFRLAIFNPIMLDPKTNQPMDEGFGAIVRNCQYLRRLSLSGMLTDKAFEYIGNFGKKLRRLSIAFAGGSNVGMQYVLHGCTSLQKLEIRDSPYGDEALLAGIDRYESMRSLWMSGCHVTMQGCRSLAAAKRGRLVVEVIKKESSVGKGAEDQVESVYVYRSIVGCRSDIPPFVIVL
ncbi:hypothetical protein KP509_16G039600 [Ceratopteris richardii]|uniref:F-box domain-containing protein n=1 Tax=Ceratopteris richardii TaxID=49495 RepID=A0A8T2SY68_CERRI|nr:hypothetical protein KP509_16G039600 [Ceratopteris richardii]KAH7387758.1 hypothetical protein KP509_16G039600 [Ceratopteris richardii]